MGYYSEVALTLRNEDFIALVNSAKESETAAYDLLLGAEILQDNSYSTIHWDYIKWNDNDPAIVFIEGYIESLPHAFLRLGEDFSDFEDSGYNGDDDEYGDMCECVTVMRSLDCSGAGEKIKLE